MKKALFMLLAVLLVLPVLLTSCKNEYDEVIHVSEIKLLDENLKQNDTWGDYTVIHENPDTGKLEYKIEYEVTPGDATDKDVIFSYDEAKAKSLGITVDDSGLVSFERGGTGMFIKVFLIPADGSDVRTSITIVALE